jgi:hypothetical protein
VIEAASNAVANGSGYAGQDYNLEIDTIETSAHASMLTSDTVAKHVGDGRRR